MAAVAALSASSATSSVVDEQLDIPGEGSGGDEGGRGRGGVPSSASLCPSPCMRQNQSLSSGPAVGKC